MRARLLRVFLAGIGGSLAKKHPGETASRCTAFPLVLDAGPPHTGTTTATDVFRALGCCSGDWLHFKAGVDDEATFYAAREGNATALLRATRDKRCIADDPWSSGLIRELGPSARGWDGFVMQTLRPTSLHWAAARYVWDTHVEWQNIEGEAQTAKLISRLLADPEVRSRIVKLMACYDTRVGAVRRANRGSARYFEIAWECGDGVAEVARAMRLNVRIDPTRVTGIRDATKRGTVGGLTPAKNNASVLGHAVSAALRAHFAREWLEPTDRTWYDASPERCGSSDALARGTKRVPPREPPPPQCRELVAAWLASVKASSG